MELLDREFAGLNILIDLPKYPPNELVINLLKFSLDGQKKKILLFMIS